MTRSAVLADAAADAPDKPGVYFFLDGAAQLLYVGKATHLRRRLRQHAAATPARYDDLYERVAEVRWRELTTEAAATAWETDLIATLAPPYNANSAGLGRWNYLVLSSADRLSFTVSGSPAGGRVYGCFPHLGKGVFTAPGIACSDGYTALLRLLWAASDDPATHIPSRLTRSAPECAELTVADSLRAELHRFLSGVSSRLLVSLSGRSARRDAYLQPGLTRDLASAGEFFTYGPSALRTLRLRHRVAAGPITRETFTRLVTADAVSAVGEFRTRWRVATGLRRWSDVD